MVVMLPFLLAVIGIAIDGQAVLRAERRAQGAADAAARTGASHIQVDHARSSPTAADLLDPSAAQQAALDYIHETYPDLRARAQADDGLLVVDVQQQVKPTLLLPLLQLALHEDSVWVAAHGQARPRAGIDRPVQSP
jgi:hypothetical protein